MNRKLAGIPVIYIAGGFVAILVIIAYRAKNSSAGADNGASVSASDAATGGDAGEPDPNAPFHANSPTPYVSPDPGVNPNPAPVSDTNDLWVRRAAQWLAANRKATANDSLIALDKYVTGDNLSFDEGRLRDLAVGQFGLPPEPIHPGNTGGYTGPASRQGTPPTHHTVKGTSDNTYAELSTLYYGNSTKDTLLLLLAANTSLGNVGAAQALIPGTVVTIPALHAPRYYRARKGAQTEYQIASRNGISVATLYALNPGVKFPISIGRGVRIA